MLIKPGLKFRHVDDPETIYTISSAFGNRKLIVKWPDGEAKVLKQSLLRYFKRKFYEVV